jgi:predicted acylesterase/phospholipase RssA
MPPVKAFVSYAHTDRDHWKKLKAHLAPFERKQELEIWDDGEILPGSDWKREIRHSIADAELILLLISPDFVSSDYCYSIELQRAMERYGAGEAFVVPIILRPAVWHELAFGDLQALPTAGEPISRWPDDEGYYDVALGIQRLLPNVRSMLVRSKGITSSENTLSPYIVHLGASGQLPERVVIEARRIINTPPTALTAVQEQRLRTLEKAASSALPTTRLLEEWGFASTAPGELSRGETGPDRPPAIRGGPRIHVLTLDSCSVRLIIQLRVLEEIENRTGKRVSEMFQLIAGTGSGAIAAAALAMRETAGKPPTTARQVADTFVQFTKQVVADKSFLPLWGFRAPRYSDKVLRETLNSTFQEVRLRDTVTDILISSYDMASRMPVLFSSRRARLNPEAYDISLADCVRGATANPFWFAPAVIGDRKSPRYILLDGSLVSSNSAMTAYTEARRAYANAGQMIFVSLGAGQGPETYDSRAGNSRGMLYWLPKVFGVTLRGTSELVDLQMRELLPDTGGGRSYFRLDPVLSELVSLDDATDTGFENIKRDGDRVVRQYDDWIAQVVSRLEDPSGQVTPVT